jgi:ribosomal protein S6E (S10)
LLSVRAGYRFGTDLQGFSAGAGVKYYTGAFTGKVDYSISPMYNDMGMAHRVSVLIDLGK